MARSVNDPLLEDRPPACVSVEGAAGGLSARHPTVLHARPQVHDRSRPRLGDDLIAVARVHRLVLISMEHDRRDCPTVSPIARRAAGSKHGYGLALAANGE